MPELVVIAGPNGAGKSTLFKTEVEPRNPSIPFVNADLLIRDEIGANATTSEQAKRGQDLARQERRRLFEGLQSFAFETVFSHESKFEDMDEARRLGYVIIVHHVCVASSELSVARVEERKTAGGHDVPENKIKERFPRCAELIPRAVLKADLGVVWENSSINRPHKPVLQFIHGREIWASPDGVPGYIRRMYP